MPTETSVLVLKLKNQEFNRGLDQSTKKLEKFKKASQGIDKNLGNVSSSTMDVSRNVQKSTASFGGFITKSAIVASSIKYLTSQANKATSALSNMSSVANAIKGVGGQGMTISRRGSMSASRPPIPFPGLPRQKVFYGSGGPSRGGKPRLLDFIKSGPRALKGGFKPPSTAAMGKAASSMSKYASATTAAGGATGMLSTAAAALGISVGALVAVVAVVVVAFVAWVKILKASLKAIMALEVSTVRMGAIIRATGHASGFTTESMMAMAKQMEATTGISKLMIADMMAVLATFREVKGDRFRQASEVILDMSKALKMDLKSAALQVGKALNDPIRGVSALSEAGIQFTNKQREQIKAMVEANNIAGAQKMILKELQDQFGGTSKAMGGTMAGEIDKLKNSFTRLWESIGEYYTLLYPFKSMLKGITWTINKLAAAVEKLNEGIKILKGINWNVIKAAYGFADLEGPAPTKAIKRFKKDAPENKFQWEPSKLVGDALAGSVGAATVARSSRMDQLQEQIAENTKRTAAALEAMVKKEKPPMVGKAEPLLVGQGGDIRPGNNGVKSVFEPYKEPVDSSALWNHKSNYTKY